VSVGGGETAAVRGTITPPSIATSFLRLVARRKTVVVYLGPEKVFVDVRTGRDFEKLVAKLDRVAVRRLQEQAVSEGLADQQAQLRL